MACVTEPTEFRYLTEKSKTETELLEKALRIVRQRLMRIMEGDAVASDDYIDSMMSIIDFAMDDE